MSVLILTEKPSVGLDFARALGANVKHDGYFEGSGYVITWAIGYLLTPLDPEDYSPHWKKWRLESLPIWVDEFKYKSLPKTKKQLDIVLALLKRKDLAEIIVATDAGREGELIARLILGKVKTSLPVYRFWSSEALSARVVKQGLGQKKSLKDYDRLYYSGLLRQKSDWFVGMNLSRMASIKMRDLFSIGRVQTAVLALIVDRRIEIDQFNPQAYFEVRAELEFEGQKFDAFWFDPMAKENSRRVENIEAAKSIINDISNKAVLVRDFNVENKRDYPDGLYSLTELQRKANILYGISAKKTLEIAQKLYEQYKCLSYPRTDSKYLGESSFSLVKDLINQFKDIYPQYFSHFEDKKLHPKNRSLFNDSKLTDHHGLIPLRPFEGPKESLEYKIYDLVLRKFISTLCKENLYELIHAEFKIEQHYFESKGKKILQPGFKALDSSSESLKDVILPHLSIGDEGQVYQSEVLSKETRPPFEYTEASLLYDMTNPARLVKNSEIKKIFRGEIGIGTQATRAQIIETLIDREYIAREKKSLIAQTKGIRLIQKLRGLAVSSYFTKIEQTGELELELQSIAEGSSRGEDLLPNLKKMLIAAHQEWSLIPYEGESHYHKKAQSSQDGHAIGSCPECQKGQMQETFKTYKCSQCEFVIWKEVAKKKLTLLQIKRLIKERKTDLISGFKSKAGKNFQAYLVIRDGKVSFEFKSSFARTGNSKAGARQPDRHPSA